ncbi:alpha/beta fold hydrolase [Egibacter rhizosphaerae]|uniref:Alpha/beta fold hydrolase n=1 Tax=Egibacter rhizosphaerae TaxID=1670831 RepID=A0A411YAE9_9ACTN|nr:alpha/beta fold hydrolase [Egibacter rhizosphaerae]QBI18175.1 alpha/beta fold hydrolase [Egibacter rhizosphaerae]
MTRSDASPSVVWVDGRPLAYVAARPTGGRQRRVAPLLLVHGFTGSKEDFDAVLPGLAADRIVVAIDLPGHGDSPGPRRPEAYDLPALAGWVLGAAGSLGWERFHLLGHSLGGLVTQRVADIASTRLRALVLADTGAGAPADEAIEGLEAIATAVRRDGLAAGWHERSRRAAARAAGAPDPARETFDRRRFHELEPGAVIGEARALVTATPLRALLCGFEVPTLILHGEHEDIWPEPDQRLLAGLIPGARRVVVPGGHTPQLDAPQAWLGPVRAFLAEADR